MPEPLVLCYHALSQDWDADLVARPEQFEWQISLLLARGYRAATFSDAVASRTDARVFAVTFDDAYRSVYEIARPLLERLGVTATVFAPTDWIGTERPMQWPGIAQWIGGPHERELLPMGWAELRDLRERGWEIGSHTCSHPHLTRLDDEQLAAEVGRSRACLEQHLDAPCRSIAYPYGDVNQRVIDAAARAGYRTAAALPEGRHTAARLLEWPRVGIYLPDDQRRFRLKVSPAMLRLRSSGVWEAAERVRERLPA